MSTEIRFYHLQKSSLEQALPDLLIKALDTGRKITIRLGDQEKIAPLSQHLWVCRRDHILPHGSEADTTDPKIAALHPIWMTAGNDNPNSADVLVLAYGGQGGDLSSYKLVCDMFDGADEEQVKAARARWKEWQAQGHTVSYWQQKPTGGWEQKA